MSLQVYLAFVAACIALALLPGPIVSLLIANGLRHGTRAALINVAGAQAGLAGLLILLGELPKRVHERLRHVASAVRPEAAFCCLRRLCRHGARVDGRCAAVKETSRPRAAPRGRNNRRGTKMHGPL